MKSKKELPQFLSAAVNNERKKLLQDKLDKRVSNITLLLEDIYQGHNASAILRTADAFALQYIYAIENRNSFSPNKEVSLGAEKWLTIKHFDSAKEAARNVKEKGYTLVATALDKNAKSLSKFLKDLESKEGAKYCFVFGTEKDGISNELLSLSDEKLYIPMEGFVQSFNVSVSAAIVLYAVKTKMKELQLLQPLKESEKEELYLKWLLNSVPDRLSKKLKKDFSL